MSMQIRMTSNKPIGFSQSMFTFQARGGDRAMQPVDPNGNMEIELDEKVTFDVSGDIEVVPNSLNDRGVTVQPKAAARAARAGRGNIKVRRDGVEIMDINVDVGGDVTVISRVSDRS